MAQPPLQLDALQVLGDPTGTRLIEAATDGSLLFTDEKVTSGLELQRLPGLQQVNKVYLVGLGGSGVGKDAAGDAYNTIQTALDDIPSNLTKDDPALVLVAPGEYTENLTVEKDGIEIRGLGRVVIKNSGDSSTVTVESGVGTPLGFRLRDVRVENDRDGRACVLLDGGALSTIGSELLELIDCDLVATGITGFQVDAQAVNNIRIQGGRWEGSATTCLLRVQQCASLEVIGVREGTRILNTYDATGTIPSTAGTVSIFQGCTFSEDVTVDLDGTGSWSSNSNSFGDTTVDGDRSVTFSDDELDTLTVNDTAVVTRLDGSRTTLVGVVGSSVAERIVDGTASFVAAATVAIVFDAPQPDLDYQIYLETELVPASFDDFPRALSRAISGFDITFPAVQTTVVNYTITRSF